MIDKDLLSRFCSIEEFRDAINQPWSEGEFSYASDGRVLVEIPRLADVPESEIAPKNVRKTILDATMPANAQYQTLDEELRKEIVSLSPVKSCPQCGGTGRCQCRDCRANHHCGRCEGSGDVVATFTYKEQEFKAVTLQNLIRLPGLQWSLDLKTEKVYFKFEGGRGVMTALRPRSED